MAFRAVKGMNDILPEEAGRWQRLESSFRSTVALYGYEELRTPIVESSDLFVRSIGETTDVVDKEMYSFTRHHESLTLRPEGTAGAARAYVEHTRYAKEAVTRWFYMGPMFRAEKPQKGRYRQFHQAGCEIYGDSGPVADAEMIAMLCRFFEGLGVGGLKVAINSIGSSATRQRYHQALFAYFEPRKAELSPHAQERLAVNPLRILDSKDERDRNVSSEAPSILEVLTDEDAAHFRMLTASLDAMSIGYQIEPRLVRGLDYYTRTLFEISSTADELGTQNALAGGGRYDGMIEGLGGPTTPAVGFALGIERLLLAMKDEPQLAPPFCYFASMGSAAITKAVMFGQELRSYGFRAEVDGRDKSLKSQLRRADNLGVRYVVVLGDSELGRGVAVLKDLVNHQQQEVGFEVLVSTIVERLRAPQPAEGAA
jgi:histidyl-tRNA synthetase